MYTSIPVVQKSMNGRVLYISYQMDVTHRMYIVLVVRCTYDRGTRYDIPVYIYIHNSHTSSSNMYICTCTLYLYYPMGDIVVKLERPGHT